ncbi:MAG: efflux RND transporter periplasmic adaptor subunit [Candidatus Kryptoniota bacterium]
MNKTIKVLIAVAMAIVVFVGCGKMSSDSDAKGDTAAIANNKVERKILYWYDPMNPTIHFAHPGKSPSMDMDLVPKYDDEDESNPNITEVDPAMVQDIGVVTAPVEYRTLTRTINTYGVVAPDERSISDINTRVGGWIEQLYFDYTGMNVREGQPMVVIYSPDLIAAEQEFLQSVSFAGVSGNLETQPSTLIKSARERLAFFGMGGKEIDELQKTGKVVNRVVIHSPSDGVILEKDVLEGQKISAGQTLFKVADLRHIWILADVFNIDMPFLKLGSPAAITYDNSQTYEGRVDFIYPEVDATARTVKARIPLDNPGMKMKVGQYVNVAIHSQVSYKAIAVPSQAVINTGLRQVVAVALGNGKFEMRDVKLGAYADGYYEITEGLNAGDAIVTSGQFLIDSDANLKSAGASLMPGMDMEKGKPGTGNRKHGD